MKIINQRSQIQDIVSCYWVDMGYSRSPDVLEKVRLLESLPKNSASIEDVVSITGEEFRSRVGGPFLCNECGEMKDTVVQLGEEPNYESSTANVCFDCLRKALALE